MRFLPLLGIAVFAFADSDPVYRALRDGVPTEILRTENVELKRDVGTITLKNGQLAFIKTAQDRPAIAVFTGSGTFRLKPAMPIEERHIQRLTGTAQIDDTFDTAVFFFTDAT